MEPVPVIIAYAENYPVSFLLHWISSSQHKDQTGNNRSRMLLIPVHLGIMEQLARGTKTPQNILRD